jgi:hypothetical protein
MTDETRERDIYLARAMGWQYVPPNRKTGEMYGRGVHCLRDPENRFWPSRWANSEDEAWVNLSPNFHEWESAKAKLLRWLAADDARWLAFTGSLTDVFYKGMAENDRWTTYWSRFIVMLTPAQVAEAAEKAMRGMETAKPGHEHPAEQRTGEV